MWILQNICLTPHPTSGVSRLVTKKTHGGGGHVDTHGRIIEKDDNRCGAEYALGRRG